MLALLAAALFCLQDDPDFAAQGEYLGEGINPASGKMEPFGIHIVALGDGKFRAVAYWGGLPGEGWTRGSKKDQWEGARDGDVVKVQAGEVIIAVSKGEIQLTKTDGKQIGSLKKQERKSPTLGQKPPDGAVVLFDGTQESLKHWKEGARISDDGLLMQGATTRAAFGDHTLHIEFRLPFEPKKSGQGRGNSGLYLQGRYEVQMLDSFGLEGRNNECGGIYGVREPDVNMCFPPMSWQTYDVEFTGARPNAPARVTVRHNGVVIHKDAEVAKTTGSAPVKLGTDDGPVFLQDHGNPVRYRNIWVIPKK